MTKSRARKFADLLDASGDIKSDALGNTSSVGGATGVDFNDSVKAQFGAGNDLRIYHDGSNSYIEDAGTGNLRIMAQDFRVVNSANSESMVQADNDGAVSLYHNNVKKFTTTADGIEALRPASDGIIQSWRRGTTELMKLEAHSTDNVIFSAMQGGGSGLIFWGSGGTDPIINPAKEGATANGTVQLGRSSERFKNLYLSAEGGGSAAIDVRQGAVKVWANFDMFGTYATRDSYNVTSLTDNGQGDGTCNYNNDFTDADRAVNGTASITGSGHGNRQFTVGHGFAGFNPNELAGSNRICLIYDNGTASTAYDAHFVSQSVVGDLA